MAEYVGVPGGDDYDDYLQTFEATLSGPEGTWAGRSWLVFDWPWIEAPAGVAGIKASLAYITTVLSGDGAYEGWTYVTTGTTSTSGPGPDLAGVLHEGPPPPGITTR